MASTEQPKGSTWFCEVCRRPGVLKCDECKVTYYCGEMHRELDQNAFHRLVCRDIAHIRGEQAFPIGEEARSTIREEILRKERLLLKRAEDVAQELLLREDFQLAYAPAMQAFHLAERLFPADSLDTIYSFILLAEVFLGLDNVKLAQDYMLQASWTTSKNNQVPVGILSKLERIKGKIFMKKEKWDKANAAFAEYVYCLAEEYGTSDIHIANGFGYLGLTIIPLRDVSDVLRLFDKMGHMWINCLLDWYVSKSLKVPSDKDMEDPVIRENECLLLEAQIVLKMIDKTIQTLPDSPELDRFIFKLYVFQTFLYLRKEDDEKKNMAAKSALIVATRTRMDDAVCEEKNKFLNEVLGEDYLLKWDKKHRRPRTVATKYLDRVKAMGIRTTKFNPDA